MNTCVQNSNMITYTSDGSANDIDFANNEITDESTGALVNYPDGVALLGIIQVSTAAGQQAFVRHKSITGDYLFDMGADVIGDGKVNYAYGEETYFPYIKNGEVPSGVKLQFYLRNK